MLYMLLNFQPKKEGGRWYFHFFVENKVKVVWGPRYLRFEVREREIIGRDDVIGKRRDSDTNVPCVRCLA